MNQRPSMSADGKLDFEPLSYTIGYGEGFRGSKKNMTSNQPHTLDSSDSLNRIKLFRDLDDEARDQVSKLIKWKQYPKEAEVIPYQGESSDVYFIASGRVRVTIFSFSGKEISYQELGPGKTFGELSAIDQLPRTANVITSEASRIGVISRRDYWKLLEQYPDIAAAAMKSLAGLVRFLIDRVYQYGALDVKDRIRIEVLRLAHESMVGEDTASIDNFPTHKEIASRVNTHREAVTRELNELSRMGFIEQNHRALAVSTVSGLTDLLPEHI
jgi:CRP/FNR family cyclic AMP-dependent transcriptional regulator